MNNEQRFGLLDHYMQLEPSIVLGGTEYKISAHEHDGAYIAFYAVCPVLQEIGGLTLVTKATWDIIETGFSMCYLYNCVLDSLEMQITKGRVAKLGEVRL
jgi:hypothetical protein